MLRFPPLNKPDMTVPTPGTLEIFSTRNSNKWLTFFSCRYLFGSANSIVLNELSPSSETHGVSKIGARMCNFPTQVVISWSFRTANVLLLTSSECIIFPTSSFNMLRACSEQPSIFVKTISEIFSLPSLKVLKLVCILFPVLGRMLNTIYL